MCICVYVCVCVSVYVNVCAYVCVHVCACVCVVRTVRHLVRRHAQRGQQRLEHEVRVQQHERALQRVQAAGRQRRHRARLHGARRDHRLLALGLLDHENVGCIV